MLSAHSRIVLLGLYGPDRGKWRLTRYDLSVPGEEGMETAGAEDRTTGEESVGSAGAEERTAGEEGRTAGEEGRTAGEDRGETAGHEARGAAGEDTVETKGRTGQNEEMSTEAKTEAEKNAENRRSRSVTETEGQARGTVEGTVGSHVENSATTAGEKDRVVGEDKQTSEVGAESTRTGTGKIPVEGRARRLLGPGMEAVEERGAGTRVGDLRGRPAV